MTKPVRLRLSRRRGFDLHAHSREVNGLPVRNVSRAGIARGLLGNPFKVTETISQEQAVKSFRRFLTVWTDKAILDAVKFEGGERAPIQGLHFLVLRNRIRANVWHLRGHNLACWCSLLEPCHADVYRDILATDLPERWKAKYPRICEEIKS